MEEFTVPFPVLTVDKDFNILYKNHFFEKWSEKWDNKDDIKNIDDIVDQYERNKYVQLKNVKGQYFDVYKAVCNEGYSITFVENKYVNKEGAIDSHVCVGILIVDNYTEVEENTDEARLPHLFAIIERKINEYFNNMGGIVRKFEKDKFLIILNRDKLAILKDENFPISEQIEKIEIGNIPVTISMGIGCNGNTLNEDMEFARGALDLALGRGGNQIVVKESEDVYEYYGGDGREVIKNSRVRARVKAYGFTELILSASDVIVMGHQNPDLDALGSAAGVFSIVNFYGKRCKIVLNSVTNAVKALYDRLTRDPKYDDAFITSEQALKLLKRNTLVVVVDTHRGVLTECPELLNKTGRVVIFDHHRKCADAIENYSLSYHEAYASSTAEMITEMMMYIKGMRATKDEIEGLLAGMMVDTKNFAFKIGIKTFETAAYLKKQGADTVSVRRLFKNTIEDYIARTEIVRSAEIIYNNVAVSVLNTPVDNPRVLIAMAADELLNLRGIETSFVLCKDEDYVCISGRSLGDINVQKLLEKMGGGGHMLGAAAQVKSDSIEEVKRMLLDKIEEYLEVKKN
ncbi:MAG: DHH family phosphoesterase [Firmicutes bacterium]|nr:DHH family phosphoesterase [Bacillota bacterium]